MLTIAQLKLRREIDVELLLVVIRALAMKGKGLEEKDE
jgi:hypothetical protein